MANLYVKAVPPADLNKNTEWFMYPGVWTTYILILFFAWLIVLSLFGCSPGMAWTVVNLCHFLVCSPFSNTPFICFYANWWRWPLLLNQSPVSELCFILVAYCIWIFNPLQSFILNCFNFLLFEDMPMWRLIWLLKDALCWFIPCRVDGSALWILCLEN